MKSSTIKAPWRNTGLCIKGENIYVVIAHKWPDGTIPVLGCIINNSFQMPVLHMMKLLPIEIKFPVNCIFICEPVMNIERFNSWVIAASNCLYLLEFCNIGWLTWYDVNILYNRLWFSEYLWYVIKSLSVVSLTYLTWC